MQCSACDLRLFILYIANELYSITRCWSFPIVYQYRSSRLSSKSDIAMLCFVNQIAFCSQVLEPKPLSQPKREPLGPGMHRSITGSSLKLSELNGLVEKAGDCDPGTPGSRSGRTPRSMSGISMSSRSSSIVQVLSIFFQLETPPYYFS